VHDFDVRTFPEHRQDILELLVALWEEWSPTSSSSRASTTSTRTTSDRRERPARVQAHDDPRLRDPVEQLRLRLPGVRLARGAHVERKVAALAKYASQQHRRYSDPEYIRNVARTHGINVNREYAEVFEVYRVVA
jgi:hypothetical protein